MTLDEAIEHARWCANNSIGECSDEHWQLTEWLTELQKLRATRTRLLAEIHGLKSLLTRLEESGVCIDD